MMTTKTMDDNTSSMSKLNKKRGKIVNLEVRLKAQSSLCASLLLLVVEEVGGKKK